MGDNRWLRNSFVYLIILVAALALIANYLSGSPPSNGQSLSFNEVIDRALTGDVYRLVESADGNTVTYYTLPRTQNDKPDGRVTKSPQIPIAEYLQQERLARIQEAQARGQPIPEFKMPEIDTERPPAWGGILSTLTFVLPMLLLIGFFVFFMRQAQGSNNQAMSFGKSRARMFTSDKPTVTFADVAGQEEAKQDLTEVVEFLKFPDKFAQLGARIPRGVLMVGPPGTGKTLLSRAVAGEAGVPFFSISGSEFVEMFVGVGASRVRDLFDQAKRNAPCIVFIDEIDAVGRQRGAGLGGSHDEREQTLNQILVEMDGFDTNTNVIVIAATNRPDVLDPALVRPGRFDRQVVLDAPDIKGRIDILKVHTKGKPLADDVNLEAIAKVTPGASGADLANIVNEAAILAARRGKKRITMMELEDATERMMLGGPERRSRVMTPEEKRLTAYHEAGHAIVGAAMPKANPVHKITIVPRGRAGGYTLFLPEDDQNYRTVMQFEADMAAAMGGRAAEELVLKDFTTGAGGDIQHITKLARAMVTRFGMSEKLGPIQLGDVQEMVFLGREIAEQRNYSEETAKLIDAEVKRLVDTAHQRALQILQENMDVLHELAQKLLEVETLGGEELRAILAKVRPYQPERNGHVTETPSPQTSVVVGPGSSATEL
ncbi:ATP-dependent zinc metalloprotease FtsH [Kallotenue papyrolyticum]|uniref:ATP-dependent zinc metalloprotease FtsH n=1 Tax=Kallotenue papyrolyticum TaxID=1325125 RepID=UPI000478543A|nr:ATP-dependent zinc metalloprotease FtsH [Kallotenue papyrolyticum]